MPRSPTPARQNRARRGLRVARHDTSLDHVQTVSRVGVRHAPRLTHGTRGPSPSASLRAGSPGLGSWTTPTQRYHPRTPKPGVPGTPVEALGYIGQGPPGLYVGGGRKAQLSTPHPSKRSSTLQCRGDRKHLSRATRRPTWVSTRIGTMEA